MYFKNYGFGALYDTAHKAGVVDKVGGKLLAFMLYYLGTYAFSRQVQPCLIEAVTEIRYLPINIAVIPDEGTVLMEAEVYDIRGIDIAEVREVVNKMNMEQTFGDFFVNGYRVYWSTSCPYDTEAEEGAIKELAHKLIMDMGELLDDIDWRITHEIHRVQV